MAKESNSERVLKQNRVLNMIINYPGEYSKEDLAEYFGITKRTVEGYIEKFNKQGFSIISRRKKYKITEGSENLNTFYNYYGNEDLKKLLILIMLSHHFNGKANLKVLIKYIANNYSFDSNSEKYIEKLVREIKADGYIDIIKGQVTYRRNIMLELNKEELLDFIIYLNIVRGTYPKIRTIRELYQKANLLYGPIVENSIVIINDNKVSSFDEDYIILIEEAILEENIISFTLVNKGNAIKHKVTPIGLVYNSYKDMWYLYANQKGKRGKHWDKIFRLDKIINLNILDEKHIINKDLNIFENSLGTSVEQLTQVKVQFEKEEFILRKVIEYKNKRKNAKITVEKEKIILIDCVNGINEFKDWVRAFGKSAKCIMPEELVISIKQDIELLKKRYILNE